MVLTKHCYAFATRRCRRTHYVFGLSVRRVRSFRQILLLRYPMNGFSNLDETCREYSLAHTDDLVRITRLKMIKAPRPCFGVQVHLLLCLARAACLPRGLYVFLALISFFLFIYF